MRSGTFFKALLFLLHLVLPLVSSAVAADPPEGYHNVRNCQNEWLVYSAEYKNYVPYVRALHESEPSVSLLLNLVQDRHFQLLLKTRKEAVLFVDGALRQRLDADVWVRLSCDSLYRETGATDIILTVFGLRGTEGLESYMVVPATTVETDSLPALSRSLISLKPKSANAYRDFSVIAWLFVLVISAVVFLSVPDIAYKVVNPLEFLSTDYRSELYNHHRAYSPVIVFAVVTLSFVAAFLVMSVEIHVTPLLPGVLSVSGRESVGSLTLSYLVLALICFVLFYLKCLLVFVTLGILNMSELAHIHFIKTVQSSMLFYGITAVALLVVMFQHPAWLEATGNVLLWSFLIYYSLRLIVLYIVLNQTSRILNLYLISYLCVVELIPLIIGIKFIM